MTPFEGQKALYWVRYWEPLLRGHIPPPVLVTLDPVGRCNLRCVWCNGEAAISKSGEAFDSETMEALPGFLAAWGVKAVCIAGGGEPLLHPHLSKLLAGLHAAGVEVGVVTNGTAINRHQGALGACRWVGVSVDAAAVDTYARLKGADALGKVLENIRALRRAWPKLEITYKYLIHPQNVKEISAAALQARGLGCNYFHARPAGVEWWQQGKETLFTLEQVARARAELQAARAHETAGFRVVGTLDKFTPNGWGKLHDFDRCWAVGMTCVISADHKAGLCCDRRGDEQMKLCDWETLADIRAAWGHYAHKRLIGNVDLSQCPRCTYAPHNRLFEAFAVRDDACRNFI
jgi:MoaA/NifB/PqqE/SkfB family radical SAM enzyme